MKAGQLRHKITIQALVAGSPQQRPNGEEDVAWTDLISNVSASVEPLSGRELLAAQAVHSEVAVKIGIRYRPGIDAAMRVLFEGRYYNIAAVIDRDMRHRELELICSQGLNDG